VQNLHRAGVVYKPLLGVPAEVEMGVVWRRGETLATLQRFLDMVNEITSATPGTGER
jgi:hypothetical protein